MSNIIDYLSEDLPISDQKYALITIVGPNMPQKCDVWGLKIRGVADTIEKAKAMTKKLMKMENTYDIYTVDVGKFFPLSVQPYDVKDVEYENVELNKLIKTYLENKEQANEHYHQRKQDMMEKAIREGKKEGQEELSGKIEHPIAVLQRKQTFEDKLRELKEEIETLEKDLELTSNKYMGYTEDERHTAENSIVNNVKPMEKLETITEIEVEGEVEGEELKTTLDDLNQVESDIEKLLKTKGKTNIDDSPNEHERLNSKLIELENTKEQLKIKLNNSSLVNDYMSKSFEESKHESLFQ